MDCECGGKPVIFRKYEGRHLCKKCFCESVEKQVKRTVRENQMIGPGDRIAFGLSGGKDSSVVLSIIHGFLKERRDLEFFAFTIDEGIEGYRGRSLEIAKALCKKLGIKHKIVSYEEEFGETLDHRMLEVKKDLNMIQTACSYCGVARKYLLNKTARELKATKLCVGHNLDDEVQSVVMNYFRGDMVKSSRMGPITNYSTSKSGGHMFVPRIKPLRKIPEKEVGLYALLKGLEVQEDECPYASGFRFEIRDFLNMMENKHTGMKFSILETFDRMVPAMRSLADEMKLQIVFCKRCGEPSSTEICKTCELWNK